LSDCAGFMRTPTAGWAIIFGPCRAPALLSWLTKAGIPWAIATSGRMETAAVNLKALGVDPSQTPVVTRDQVKYGGYGASELQQATAFRVYEDPADLLVHIDEVGGRR
jgi:beta-phosphoglucomutase-like phosphatase (HAD superfamily)